MAIVSFGATFRGANAGFALTNTSAGNIQVPALGLNIAGHATEVVTFNEFDGYARSPRNPQVYERNGLGKLFIDDVAALAAQISAGTLLVKGATYNSGTNTFTVGASAAFTAAAGDGSVFFA